MANLYKMYKGLEGSPTSKIVQGISVSATTIVVQDPSVLPAAPNFACLFDDTGKVEVVEYTQKSGQTLTCIRGVSGQRLEWPVATSIARNFTSIDYNNLVDNVSMMNVELNELTLEYGYIFDSVIQGDFVQQVLQMAEQVETLNGEVNTMLDSLTTLEAQLQVNEQARQTNETTRQTVEDQRVSAESGRVTAEQSRASVEAGRVAAEQTRQSNEQTRQNNEDSRTTAESDRVTVESSRVTAEQGRATAESSRVLVEQDRVTAESGRVTAEQTREQKETTRQTNETARQTAESSRASAEAQRTGNETTRQTNETSRQTAEGQRASAESLRINAETSRQTNETSRVAAETSRVTAEDARVANETNRQSQLTAAINDASNYAQLAEGYKNTAGSSAQYAESMKDQSASYAIDAEASAVRAESVATSLGGIQDWALQPTKPTYTPSEIGAAPEVHSHYISSILDFPTSMPASDVYPWAKDESKPIYTAAEIGASEIGHVHDYAPSTHNHVAADIIDFPESMPASDVSAWAKQPSKPEYTYSEVGAASESHSHDLAYLGINAKAADSDKLDGYHATDFAGSVHEHGRITYNGVDNGVVSAHQVDGVYYGSPAGWASYLIMNHGNGANYYHQMLRLPFGGGLQSQVMSGGTLSGWRTYLDSANFINYVYPVGAIYMSLVNTSPATLFGGTWSAIHDRFLLGAGSSYSVGATGGATTHTLSVNEMPAHNHTINNDTGQILASTYQGNTNNSRVGAAVNTGNSNWDFYISNKGGGAAHNNMPPWYAVYMWRRTA